MLWSFPKIDPETFGTDWAFPLSYNGKRKKGSKRDVKTEVMAYDDYTHLEEIAL